MVGEHGDSGALEACMDRKNREHAWTVLGEAETAVKAHTELSRMVNAWQHMGAHGHQRARECLR